MTRHKFLQFLGATAALARLGRAADGTGDDRLPQNSVLEKSFHAAGAYRDPFNEVDFRVRITFPDGTEKTYPGFWAGHDVFKFRFSASRTGTYRYATLASNERDAVPRCTRSHTSLSCEVTRLLNSTISVASKSGASTAAFENR